GRGDGTFQPPVTINLGPGCAQLESADFNGDGKLDLAVVTYSSNPGEPKARVQIFLGRGDGTFQAAQIVASSSTLNVSASQCNGAVCVDFAAGVASPLIVAVADLNRDRKPDLIVAEAGLLNISVLLGKGDGSFLPAVRYTAGAPVA